MLKVKVCGLTNRKDAHLATGFGADALGFIFYEKSPRYVTPAIVQTIVPGLPPFVTKVGVFVNKPIQEIHDIFNTTGLDLVQLHGDESEDYCNTLQLPFIKVFRVGTSFESSIVQRYHRSKGFLFDTHSKDLFGGTGTTFAWQLITDCQRYGRVILAGGLNSDNVAQAVRQVRPYAVDVSSGIEGSPGKKDGKKMRQFFDKIRKIEMELHEQDGEQHFSS